MEIAFASILPRVADLLRALGGASLVIATSLALGLPGWVVLAAV